MNRAEPDGIILDLKRFATDDGPGIRTTVFFKGCPLACAWCHSPESIGRAPELAFYEARCLRCGACAEVCPSGAQQVGVEARSLERASCDNCGLCVDVCPAGALEMRGRRVGAGRLVADLAADAEFYRQSGGGVTISGGEPTLQPAFLEAVLAGCRERGLTAALDTSGYVAWRVLSDLLPLVDLFLFDLKHMEPTTHRQLTGVANGPILRNLERLGQAGARVQVRLPLIPGLNDSPGNVSATAAFAREAGAGGLALLPYNKASGSKYRWLGRPYPLESLEPQTEDYLVALADIAWAQGIPTQLGG